MTSWVRQVLVLSGLWMVVVLPVAVGAQPQTEHSEAKESTSRSGANGEPEREVTLPDPLEDPNEPEAGPVEQFVRVYPTVAGWNSFNIPLSSYSSISLNNVFQIKLVGTPFGTSTVYLDNMYFYNVPTIPTVAAPTPTAAAADVISLFSNAYTNVAGVDWFPNWGQSTVVTHLCGNRQSPSFAGLL